MSNDMHHIPSINASSNAFTTDMMHAPKPGPSYFGDMPGFPARSDPYFNDVVLLIRGNGFHGSSIIKDSSPRPKVITNVGCSIDTTKYKFRPSSILCAWPNGPMSYFYANLGSEGLMRGDFTIEIWGYGGNNNSLFYPMPSEIGGPVISTNWNWNAAWNHWALVRRSGWIYTFWNGVIDPNIFTSPASNRTYYNGSLNFDPVYFGIYAPSIPTIALGWEGNFGDIRITRDHGRYWTNFDVKPTPYLREGVSTYVVNGIFDVEPAPGPDIKGLFIPAVQVALPSIASNVPTTAVASVTVDLSSQRPAADDIIVIGVAWEDSGGQTMTTPSGFSSLGDDNQSGSHLSVYAKVAAGSETSVVFALNTGTSTMIAVGGVYRFAEPILPTGFTISGDATTQAAFTPTGQSTVPEHGLTIGIGASHDGTTLQNCTVSGTNWLEDITGFKIHADKSSSTTSPTRAICVASNIVDNGTVGAPTFTWNVSGTRHNGCTMQLAPRNSPLYM